MFSEGRILDYLIVGIVALIVVGPKDLPILMRKVGRFLAHMRGMAAEFRASFDEMARQSELDELRREVEALRTGAPLRTAVGLDSGGGVQDVFEDIHASLKDGQAQLHPMMSHQYPSSLDAPVAPPIEPASPVAMAASQPDDHGVAPPPHGTP